VDVIVIALSASLSLLLPLTIICLRHTVKLRRKEIIRDLEKIFRLGSSGEPTDRKAPANACEPIVPSFEFVKFKYFVRQPEPHRGGSDDQSEQPQDIPTWAFLISSLPLMLSLFVLGVVTFGALLPTHTRPPWPIELLPSFIGANAGQVEYNLWLSVLMVAYFSAYLFTIRMLLRAVSNFDLSPATFLSATVHVLLGVVTAVLVAVVAEHVIGPNHTSAALLVTAFAIGFVPDLGLRALLRATTLNFFKRQDTEVLKAYTSTPLEVIDGIDSEITSRLSEHHIGTVQNLATTNPIMLFVETPYGVYQIIDWVAQAQLCAVVGSKGLTEMWKLGIRTIFDLERAVLHDGFTTPHLRHAIGRALIITPEARKALSFDTTNDYTQDSDATVVALVQTVLDDLHVQRLRQIWNRISERLDTRNLELIKIAPRGPKGTRPYHQADDGLARPVNGHDTGAGEARRIQAPSLANEMA
jgi:hypothetical protein